MSDVEKRFNDTNKVLWTRLNHAFEEKNFSDCTFLISETYIKREIKAHKLILLMASPEFAKFLDKKNDDTFIVTDIPFEIIENVLRYMYTNRISLSGDTKKVAIIWYAACKLGLKLLAEQCSELLKITFENCINVYELCAKAKKFDQSLHVKLERKCLQVFTVMTPEVLQSKFFRELEPSFLPALINHEPLNINEINLFKAVVDFAKYKEYKDCKDIQDVAAVTFACLSETEKKEATFDGVSSAVKNIRFLEINSEDFNIYVAQSGFLSKEETEAIRESIRTGDPSSLPLGFSKKGKRYQSLQLKPADEETLSERKKDSEYASFSLKLIKLESGEQSKLGISNNFTLMNSQWKLLVLKKLVRRNEYCTIYVYCLGNDSSDWKCHAQMDILGKADPNIKVFDNISWFCYQRGYQYQHSQSLSIMKSLDKLNITMEASLDRKGNKNAHTSISVKHDKKIDTQNSDNQPRDRPREERVGCIDTQNSDNQPRDRPREERVGCEVRREMAPGGRRQTNYKYTKGKPFGSYRRHEKKASQ